MTGALTPNVRVENPEVRKIVGNILGWAVILLLAVTVVDMNVPALDLAWLTVPAAGSLAGLQSLWQLIVTSPNVPS